MFRFQYSCRLPSQVLAEVDVCGLRPVLPDRGEHKQAGAANPGADGDRLVPDRADVRVQAVRGEEVPAGAQGHQEAVGGGGGGQWGQAHAVCEYAVV